jgi:hypothetical protein
MQNAAPLALKWNGVNFDTQAQLSVSEIDTKKGRPVKAGPFLIG